MHDYNLDKQSSVQIIKHQEHIQEYHQLHNSKQHPEDISCYNTYSALTYTNVLKPQRKTYSNLPYLHSLRTNGAYQQSAHTKLLL